MIDSQILGERLRDSYEILSVLGSGGMGVVYKARHLHLDKFVAIKMLKSGHYNATTLQRFHREGKIASTLSHPNIVGVYDFGLNDTGQPFMVMELVEGISLSKQIKKLGHLTIKDTLDVARQLCEALNHAHKREILHRDIKPGNVMLIGETFNLKVVDFGIAKSLDSQQPYSTLTNANEALGSPLYMSPEQTSGQTIDARCDLYSLGCIVFECLTGAPPIQGETTLETMTRRINEQAPTLSDASPGREFPRELEEFVAKLLEREPDKRYQSSAECLAALDIIGKPTISETDDTAPKPKPERGSRFTSKHLVLALIAFVITISVAATFLVQQPRNDEHDKPLQSIREIVEMDPQEPASEAKRKSDLVNLRRQISKSSERVFASNFEVDDSDLHLLTYDKQLKELYVSKTPLTDEGFEVIAQLHKLEFLEANQTRMTNTAITHLSRLPKLQALHVNNNRLDVACTPHLSKITTLLHLGLNNTAITDAGIKNLAPLNKLILLQVNQTQITDAGIKTIVESFPNLQELQARRNKGITEKSLEQLAKLQSLRRLTVSDCSISTRYLQDFFKSHPQIIEHQTKEEAVFEDGNFEAPPEL